MIVRSYYYVKFIKQFKKKYLLDLFSNCLYIASLENGVIMNFEGLICPACSVPLDEKMLESNLKCIQCSTNLKQKI